MPEASLQRTVRRGIALALLPLCALVRGFENYVWSDMYAGLPPGAFGPIAYVFVPVVLFVGALAYLTLSGFAGLLARLDPAYDEEA
jgi:hypothetical protein